MAAGGIAVVWLLLVATIDVGLAVPGGGRFAGYPDAARVGATRPKAGFVALSARFIARVFGNPDSHNSGRAVSGSARARSTRAATDGGVVVKHSFTNDAFAQAYPIPSTPFTARTNTRSATRESSDPKACSPAGGTAWYRYVPAADQSLRADTFGSGYAAALGVFRGNDSSQLVLVGCDTNAVGNAQVSFSALKAVSYYFQVAGPAGGGDLVFDLDPVGATELVSRSSAGVVGDSNSTNASVSGDGRYVAFESVSTNFDPSMAAQPECHVGAAPKCIQVYVRDRATGVTQLVSRSSSGIVASEHSYLPAISADGRFVAFQSDATNLVPGDTNQLADVFVRDLKRGITERVSVSSTGAQMRTNAANALQTNIGNYKRPAISADGSVVAFTSSADGLDPRTHCSPAEFAEFMTLLVQAPPPGRCSVEVYVRDRVRRTTELVSQRADGKPSSQATSPSLSADGTRVAFAAIDGVTDPQRGCTVNPPCFRAIVRDRRTGVTRAASVSSNGVPANWSVFSDSVSVSGDGNRVAFQSEADNLVPGDTNLITDTFVFDLTTGVTVLASAPATSATQPSPPRSPANNVFDESPGAIDPATGLSRDGRFVVFNSEADNLVPNDTNAQPDIFVYDLATGATVIVSVGSDGAQGMRVSSFPVISGNGTAVAFQSNSTFASDDDNRHVDVFLHDVPVRPSQ